MIDSRLNRNIILEDDSTPFGGVAFQGETLGHFCDEVGINLEEAILEDINDKLKECGIKPIFWKEEI